MIGVVVCVIVERRRQEWLAQGGNPEDEPNFNFGRPDSGTADYMG